MKENDVVGIVPSTSQLDSVQQGLHYARHVLLMDCAGGAAMPPVGRGAAVAAAGGWVAHVGRATVLVGTSAQVLAMLALGGLRGAVVAVIAGPTHSEAAAAVRQLAATHEAHLAHLAGEPLRVIVSDVGLVCVQVWQADNWCQLGTVQDAPEPAKRKGRAQAAPAPAPEPAPHPEPQDAPQGEPASAVLDTQAGE